MRVNRYPVAVSALVLLIPMLGAFTAPTDAQALEPGLPPMPVYRHVTTEAGLGGFLHGGYIGSGTVNGQHALFTELTGPGACWLDHDQDGRLDLYLVSGIYQTEPHKNDLLDPHSRLYRNNGDGTFTDVTDAAGARTRGVLQGCAAADYDNNGWPDLYITGWNGSRLLRNDGDGTFTDVTTSAGVGDADCGAFACWASSATWFDSDRDGCLDLFVAHFMEFDPLDPPPFNGPGPGQENRFFRSDCDGTFTDATVAAGFDGVKSDSWSAVAADLDNDGWPDLYVSNDGDANDLYHNDGDGTFTRASGSVAADGRSGMGTAIADFDHSGRHDIVTTNYISQHNGIFKQVGNDYFDIGSSGPFTDAWDYSGWAAHWSDIDNDGHLDLMIVNGDTEDYGIVPMAHPLLAYRNLDGAGAFESVRTRIGADFAVNITARGAAWADYDDDGDVDVLVGEAGEAPTHLLRADGVGNHFLNVDLVGTAQGVTRDAIGARVTLSAPGLTAQMQEKVAGSGFMSSNDPRLHFGLGDATSADLLVRWPDGSTETYTGVRASSFVRVTQGAGLEVVRTLPLIALDGPDVAVQRLDPAVFSLSVQLAPDRSVASVDWDHGDGPASAGGLTHQHAFSDVGGFVVRATVTDDAGARRTQWTTVTVVDDLEADIQMDAAVFAPTQRPSGKVLVRFSDGAPVRSAEVELVVRRSTGDEMIDQRIAQLPFFLQQFSGFVPFTFAGTTDDNGTFRFEVPHNIPSPSDLVAFEATHPGTYYVEATGGARGSVFGLATATYHVGADPSS